MKCAADIVGIDTETHLIENRYEVPDGVVAGLCSGRRFSLLCGIIGMLIFRSSSS